MITLVLAITHDSSAPVSYIVNARQATIDLSAGLLTADQGVSHSPRPASAETLVVAGSGSACGSSV
jgi:hypothetical protein